MKNTLLTLLLVLVLVLLIGAGDSLRLPTARQKALTTHEIVSCGDIAPAEITADENGKFVPLLRGWGGHSYTISTTSDSTQIYFNQGLSFYYGYHFREALASF